MQTNRQYPQYRYKSLHYSRNKYLGSAQTSLCKCINSLKLTINSGIKKKDQCKHIFKSIFLPQLRKKVNSKKFKSIVNIWPGDVTVTFPSRISIAANAIRKAHKPRHWYAPYLLSCLQAARMLPSGSGVWLIHAGYSARLESASPKALHK